MKTRFAQLLFLALAGTLFSAVALASQGNHARHHQGNSGGVIYFGSSHSGQFHAPQHKPPAYHQHNHGYRQGYRDGYRDGTHDSRRHSRHQHEQNIPTWKKRYADVLPSSPHRSHSHRRSHRR